MTGAVVAQQPPQTLPAQAPIHSNPARNGNFSVMQVSTDNPDQFVADWQKPGSGASLRSTSHIARQHPLVTFLIFQGCTADAAGHCNVTARVTVTDPSGKPSGHPQEFPVAVGRAPPPAGVFQLSPGRFALTFDDGDPLGKWHFDVDVIDHVSGVMLKTEQLIAVEAQ